MRPEAPDTRFYAELRDLNREFLRLVVDGRRHRSGSLFGLDAAIADQIARLTAPQLQGVAETRCLLAGLGRPARQFEVLGIAETRPDGTDPRWLDAARVFAASLVTYAWQVVRRDSLRAALCLGPLAAEFRELEFREAQRYSAVALLHLEARFHQHQRLWPDLVRAARDGNEEGLRLARLGAVQLALSDTATRRLPGLPVRAYARAEVGGAG